MIVDVGIDVGSVSVNCVVIDDKASVIYEAPYVRHFGRVMDEAERLLAELPAAGAPKSSAAIRSVSFTGVHGRTLAEIFHAPYEVETIAQAEGTLHVAPRTRSIISMGGQDAALLQVNREGSQWHLEAFNMNGPCASGTGSFIDQQAERLAQSMYGGDFHMTQDKLQETLEDFIELGLRSDRPAPVACRCTVFTKSDMIHLQNKGETLPNIIAGLHYGNAANYMSTIVGNRKLHEPIVMIGGMASNRLQVKALRRYFPRLEVPPHHLSLGALGTALLTQRRGVRNGLDLSLLSAWKADTGRSFPTAEPLEVRLTRFEESRPAAHWPLHERKGVRAFLGVDIGSTTTKHALIDEKGNILHKCYLPTRGKPIETTRELLHHLKQETGEGLQLLAVATTGSGRNVVGDFLHADLVMDEITAHARGAVAVDPDVDTIFEIGGQDSKYIRLERSHPLDFDMNKVCAAGTGSFLHELANKMQINIVGEFQDIALSSRTPLHLAERCTVFMESDVVGYAQQGATRRDLIAGLCYAIVHNYLNRVVEKRSIGDRIMFLGGPSLNKGIVAAFEKVLNKTLLVPRNREVMGAFGAALMVKEHFEAGKVGENRHDLERLIARDAAFSETVCKADRKCHNECKLKVYTFGDRKSIWGGECGRYEVSRHDGAPVVSYFQERQRLFQEFLEREGIFRLASGPPTDRIHSRPTVGIPHGLHTLEWGILWSHMFANLGFDVVLSPRTDNGIVLSGIESMMAETCFPVKVFHGHVRSLMNHVDYLFLPNMINMPTPQDTDAGLICPLVESSQYMAKAALRIPEERLIHPDLFLKDGPGPTALALHDRLPGRLRLSRNTVEEAVRQAWDKQAEFRRRMLRVGRDVIQAHPSHEPLWIITGRPYNLYDDRLNLQIGTHLAKLGISALPMDFLDLDGEDLSDFPRMYWGLGARILKAAKRISRTPNWYGVHLTNFSCGADSFIEHFYRHILSRKPYLILELDEHSAVAGALTRMEAYRSVVANVHGKSALSSCSITTRTACEEPSTCSM